MFTATCSFSLMRGKCFCYLETPIGNLRLRASNEGLLAIDHVNQQGGELADDWAEDAEHPILAQALEELAAYFNGSLTKFACPLAPGGTVFQQRVWDALQEIPYGETRSYSDIAHSIGNPKSVRAVGLANGKNPISIFIPCHRVIGKNGKLVGYAGGVEVKTKLLDIEQRSLF